MILITGASGFIGKNLTFALAEYSKLRILVRKTSRIEPFIHNKNIEIAFGDIEKNIGLSNALQNIEIVVHAAARTIGRDFNEYYRTNVVGTDNLVKAMEKMTVMNIILISSHAACGPCPGSEPLTEQNRSKPISMYGKTKYMAEKIVTNSTLNHVILQPVAVYGPHDLDILRYIKIINQGFCPVIGTSSKYMNLIYVDDLIQTIVGMIRKRRFTNKTYFISDGECYLQEEVLKKIAGILHKRFFKINIPYPLAMFYGLVNDVFLPTQKRFIWRDKIREMTQRWWLCNNTRIVEEFNFKPRYSLDQGMRKTIVWYQNQGFLKK